MSIELQLRTPKLIEFTTQTLRQALRTTCLPSAAGISVDHIDVVASGATVAQVGNSIEMRFPADVFLVTDADLFAAPNTAPKGATSPAGTVTFPVRLDVQTDDDGTGRRTWLRLDLQRPVLGALEGPLGGIADAIWKAVSGNVPNARMEITQLTDILKVGNLDQVDVVAGNGIVAVRFGGAGPAQSHLAPADQWGLFVSGDAVTRMIRGLIEPHLKGALSIVSIEAEYEHLGATPYVDTVASVMLDILSARLGAAVEVGSALQLLSGPPPFLRISVNWGIDIETALLIPIVGPAAALAMKPIVQAIATAIVSSAFDVTDFGATQTGNTSFILDEALPALELGLATLRYDSLVADGAGMVLAGAVAVGAVANTPFGLTVSRFGSPTRIQLCSVLSRTGSGNPSREPTSPANTSVFAMAEIEGAGRFCQIELLSPDSQWRSFVRSPADGAIAERGTIQSQINYGRALTMPKPMTFLVRTPRGVRYLDFGLPPPPIFDEDGHLVVLLDAYIPDCKYVVVGETGGGGIGWHGNKDDFKPVPHEVPGWADYLSSVRGVIVQLVTLDGLDPGEFVRFRSATHAIEATADANGRLLLPVLLPLVPAAPAALLERADGSTLASHVSSETAAFEWVADLSGRLAKPAAALPSGELRLLTRTKRGLARHSVGAHGVVSTAQLQDDVEQHSRRRRRKGSREDDAVFLNPQPLPPGEDHGMTSLNPQPLPPVDGGAWPADSVRRLGLRNVERVSWVPGFTGRSVALAHLGHRHLLLDLAGKKVRVAGIGTGSFGPLDTSKHFAFSAQEDRVMVFARLEAPPTPTRAVARSSIRPNARAANHSKAS